MKNNTASDGQRHSRAKTLSKPVVVDDRGVVDLGLYAFLVGSEESYAETHASNNAEYHERMKDRYSRSDSEWFDALRCELIPIVSSAVERFDPEADADFEAGPEVHYLIGALELDLKDGRSTGWYRLSEAYKSRVDESSEATNESFVGMLREYYAWGALCSIAVLEADRTRMHVAIDLGRRIERLSSLEHPERLLDAANAHRARKSGGAATARLTIGERKLVVESRDRLAKQQDRPKSWAASQIASQLRSGTFSGIDRVVDYSDAYVVRLRVER